MGNLTDVWTSLSANRKVIVVGATIAVFAAVLMLARGAASRDMALLYAGLDSAAAGDVVTALDQRGAVYDVRGNSIFVPTPDRDLLRMSLAGEGLPANSAQGYELLDSLSGFGTTAQMFDAAYWRAKEGELARTMVASPHIRAARVHISASSAQTFRRDERPSAAVTVTTLQGALARPQAEALRFLVASAVPGLAPADVAVIDGVGGLMTDQMNDLALGDPETLSAGLKARVERLLSARVGPGNAVVEVSVATQTETESIVERRFDPDSRIAISTDVQESTMSSQDNRSGDVTVASNLPDGDAGGAAGTAQNENTESRAVTNYEVSETQREVLRQPGAISRVTVAVLVNGTSGLAEDGTTIIEPRSPEELEDLRTLVASAVGLDVERGDEITIRSMPFETLPAEGTTAEGPTPITASLDMMRLIQIGVLAIVALILGLFVVRPVLASQKSLPPPRPEAPPLLGDPRLVDGISTPVAASNPSISDGRPTPPAEPVDRLRALIDERRDDAVQLLESWIDDGPKPEVQK